MSRPRVILVAFEEAGVVERKLRSRWVATPRGLALSRELAMAWPARERQVA